MITRAFPVLALLAACASSRGPAPGAKLPPWNLGQEMREIARLEDARSTGGGRLLDLLRHADPALRGRAAEALGRMPFAEDPSACTRSLLLALLDPEPAVRAKAAFALGLRGDASAADKLLFLASDQHEADPEALVRARAVEAASRLARPELRERTLLALGDPDPRVRLEAAQGTQRWAGDEPGAAAVNARLAAHLETEGDPQVALYALASLERRKAPEALAAFLRSARSDEPLVRLFAVRGLKALAPRSEVEAPLASALGDRDWRAACEAALGLGAFDTRAALDALAKGTRAKSPHVRRCAWEALAARADRAATREAAQALHAGLQGAWLDRAAFEREPSLSVRAAFVELEMPLLSKLRGFEGGWTDERRARVLDDVERLAAEQPAVVLAGLARALARIADDWARQAAAKLARHPDPWVAGQAVESLGRHASADTRALLHELLQHSDNGIRLAALTALSERPDPADIPALERAFRTSAGDIAPEIRFNVLRCAGKIGGDAALGLVRAGELEGVREASFLARVAREELRRAWNEGPADVAAAAVAPAARVPLAGEDFPAYAANPLVEVRTTRGLLEFELFPAEAPVHVHSFLALAGRGHYDGLRFHRVVPDFVVQGGDPRGDGNGGASWRGDALRHEFGPRKFARGALGMPRNDDPDSGGSQVFVTHRPTPHLDGRYTLFGELRQGGEVLDALEVGDRILSVRLRP